MEQPIVDTHVHFWDPDQLEYPWLEDVPGLNNAFLPEDYQNSSVTVNVEKIVFVECDCAPGARLDEVAWVTALAKNETRIQGIVASAPLETGEVAQGHLEELAANPLVKGIRRLLEEAAVDFCIQPGFVRGVQLLADLNFSFDICITHVQLANTINLVKQCPDVQFVLDHIGKPDIKSERFEPWRAEIKTLSQVPNVSCKISGLVTEADWEKWTRTDLKP